MSYTFLLDLLQQTWASIAILNVIIFKVEFYDFFIAVIEEDNWFSVWILYPTIWLKNLFPSGSFPITER